MRLTVRTTLAAIVLGLVVSVIACGYFMPYWRKADQDLALAYQGLLFNDGAPQNYFDHTGYIYYLAIGAWYAFLHAIGALPIDSLSAMPPSTDAAAFNAAWTNVVRAGRLFSLTLTCVFALSFFGLVRTLLRDSRIAVLVALAVALSGSFALHARMMRTELVSSYFTTVALMLALLAAGAAQRGRQALLLAGAGLCAVLAMETKIQALIVLMAFPLIVIAFGAHAERYSIGGGWKRAAVLAIAAAMLAPSAVSVVWRGLEAPGVSYPALGAIPDGLYQLAILVWPILAVGVYAYVWRRRASDAALALVALGCGAALGVLALLIRFDPRNVAALPHPIEHMFSFATVSHPELAGQTVSAGLSTHIIPAIAEGLGSHTFFLNPTARPTLLIEWFAITAAVVAWRQGARMPALRVAALVGSAWAIDSVFALRGLKDAYLAYTDPLLILAGAVMVKQFPKLMESRRARAWAIGLGCLSLVWAQVEPIKLVLSQRDPSVACGWLPSYLPDVRFPFCKG
jgi:hypothetical protein